MMKDEEEEQWQPLSCSHRGMALGDNALEGGGVAVPNDVTAALALGSSFRAPIAHTAASTAAASSASPAARGRGVGRSVHSATSCALAARPRSLRR